MAQSRKTSHIFGSLDILNYQNVNNRRITSVGAPILPSDATNKEYVDNIIMINDLHSGIGITINTNGNTLNINSNQPTINGVGTLSQGTWNADNIQISYGGTGQTNFSSNKLIYYSGNNSLMSTQELTFDTNTFNSSIPIYISSTMDINNSGGGALNISGGVFISKSVFVNENVNINGNITVNGNIILNTVTAINSIFVNASIGTLFSNNINALNIKSSNITSFLFSTSNLISSNITSNNLTSNFSTFSNAIFTNLSSSSLNVSGITILSTTNCRNLSTGSLNIVDGKCVNLLSNNFSCGSLNVTSTANLNVATISNLRTTNMFNSVLLNTNIMNATISTLINITNSNLVSNNSTITNCILTNICSGNINILNTLNTLSISTGSVFIKGNLNSLNIINTNTTTNNIVTSVCSIGNLNVNINSILQGNLHVLGTSLLNNLNVNGSSILDNLSVNINTNLNSLSVSGTSNLNNTSISNLVVSNTSISNLVVSGLTSISNLFVNNTSIANLFISNNSILNTLSVNSTSNFNIINSSNISSGTINTSSIINTKNFSAINTTISSLNVVLNINSLNSIITNISSNSLYTNTSSIGNNFIVNSSSINSTISNLTTDNTANFNKNINLIGNYSGSNNSVGAFLHINNSQFTNNNTVNSSIISWYANYIASSTLLSSQIQVTNKTSNLYIQSNVSVGINQTINYNSALSLGYVSNITGGNLNAQLSFERADGNPFAGIYTESSTNKLIIINSSISGGGGLGVYTVTNAPITFSSIPSSTNITPNPYIQLLNTTSSFLSTVESNNVSSGSVILMGGLGVSKTINCNNLNINGNINGTNYGLFTLSTSNFNVGTSNILFNTVFNSRLNIVNEIITFIDAGIYSLTLTLNGNTVTNSTTLIQLNLQDFTSGTVYQTSSLNTIWDLYTQITGNFMIQVQSNQQLKFTLNNSSNNTFSFNNIQQYSRLIINKVG